MRFTVFLVVLLLYAAIGSAVVGDGAGEPVKREMQLIYVFDGKKPEFVFVIGQAGFKSVDSFKEHLKTWAAGSELRWVLPRRDEDATLTPQ